MPIFNNEITFIHIPKCGGTTIEDFLVSKGNKISLFDPTGSISINGHSPQHCTYRELQDLNILTENIFTIVRDNKDRVISEYFWIMNFRPNLQQFNSFDEFLDLFLDKKNSLFFDNHNLSNEEFLINKEGVIDPRIKIFDFFDHQKIEEYLGLTGLGSIHSQKSDKEQFSYKDMITDEHIKRINKFYEQ